MSIDKAVSIEYEDLFKNTLSHGINLFLGAGFSVLATNDDNCSLPTGPQLKDELLEEFNRPELQSLSLDKICTILERTKRTELHRFLMRRFHVRTYDKRYDIIDSKVVNIRSIFTTNIDDLLYRVFSNSRDHFINDITHSGPVFRDRRAIDLVPLHGSIVGGLESIALSTLDIAAAFQSDPDKWHFLTEGLQRFSTLFWGYSVEDSGVLEALSPNTVRGRETKPSWIVLKNPDDATKAFFRALGFNIIVGDTASMLDYLGLLVPYRETSTVSAPSISTPELFPDDVIPPVGSVPVRPLREFYLGEAPTWYDIFHHRIHKTHHYSSIMNSIYSGKNTVVIGIPACGKTTLLMQVANGLEYNGHKLVCSLLTTEKARFITRRLGDVGARAIVFVDNLADNADAFEILIESNNTIAIGFEREYNFEIVSHRFNRSKLSILDVTDLNSEEIQEIYSRIPVEIRTEHYVQPKLEPGVELSVHEVIESNILTPRLSVRYKTLLKSLAEEEHELHDLLVMVAYVHSCRVPVSFDMAYAFLQNVVSGYEDVFTMVDRLGALVTEYLNHGLGSQKPAWRSGSREEAYTDQDYWVPRSTIVAEAILEQVTSQDFKEVFVQFHRTVSPYRIVNYDTFKRKAFDSRHALRAFSDWEEGLKFYEEVYERDPSPYLLQQGALYLNHRRQFDSAFKLIDDAVLQSKYKIPSIRHSHAIILFAANINKPDSEGDHVRITLDQSMTILSECYKYDKRKTYHALTFADQALKYWDRFSDNQAKRYLENALRWLHDERRSSPWNRKVGSLIRQVQSVLLKTG